MCTTLYKAMSLSKEEKEEFKHIAAKSSNLDVVSVPFVIYTEASILSETLITTPAHLTTNHSTNSSVSSGSSIQKVMTCKEKKARIAAASQANMYRMFFQVPASM